MASTIRPLSILSLILVLAIITISNISSTQATEEEQNNPTPTNSTNLSKRSEDVGNETDKKECDLGEVCQLPCRSPNDYAKFYKSQRLEPYDVETQLGNISSDLGAASKFCKSKKCDIKKKVEAQGLSWNIPICVSKSKNLEAQLSILILELSIWLLLLFHPRFSIYWTKEAEPSVKIPAPQLNAHGSKSSIGIEGTDP